MFDDPVVAKWRAEIVEQDRALVEQLWGGEERFNVPADPDHDEGSQKQWPRDPITDAQLDYMFDELRHDAKQRDPETGIVVSPSLHA